VADLWGGAATSSFLDRGRVATNTAYGRARSLPFAADVESAPPFKNPGSANARCVMVNVGGQKETNKNKYFCLYYHAIVEGTLA